MIPWLDTDSPFPDLSLALSDPDGLLAAGADLSCQRLIDAYSKGIFPWYNPGEPILWWSPNPRCVVTPGQHHISRSLKKKLRKQNYKVTFDQAFSDVVKACAAPRIQQAETWINNDIYQAYYQLHQQGYAHSVEIWQHEQLIGGLYGVSLGKVFFGESMFSRQPDASKIAFIWLIEQLHKWDYALIDCQVRSDHLVSLGAKEIAREHFTDILATHCTDTTPGPWQFDLNVDWYEKDR